MPVSDELKKLLGESKLNKKRPTGATWTCGKRWDRVQTVKRNLEKLQEENEVQYAIFLTYPNPKGDPSHYLYMGGEQMQKFVRQDKRFTKSFLEVKPEWTNPPTFVLSEKTNKRKRLRTHDSIEDNEPEETGVLLAGQKQDTDVSDCSSNELEENGILAVPNKKTDVPALSNDEPEESGISANPNKEPDLLAPVTVQTSLSAAQNEENAMYAVHNDDTGGLAATQLDLNIGVEDLIQENRALFQNQEKMRFQNPSQPFTYKVNNKYYLVGPVRKEPNQRLKGFKHLMTEPRPASVNVFSLVRDTIARLPNGKGFVGDIAQLLSDSQYITRCKSISKLLAAVVYCLPILANECHPCVAFNKDTHLFHYQQYGFTIEEHKALEEKLTQPQQKKRRAAEMKTKSVAVARDSELAACGEKSKISNPMSSAICTAEASDPTEPKGSELTVANLDSTMPPICGASYPAEEVINGEASTSFDPLASDPVNHCEATVTVLTLDDFAGSEVGSRRYAIHSDGKEDQEIEIRGVPIAWTEAETIEFFAARFCTDDEGNN